MRGRYERREHAKTRMRGGLAWSSEDRPFVGKEGANTVRESPTHGGLGFVYTYVRILAAQRFEAITVLTAET